MLDVLQSKSSSWYRLVRVMADLRRCVEVNQMAMASKSGDMVQESNRLRCALHLSDIPSAEDKLFKLTQLKYMPKEFEILSKLRWQAGKRMCCSEMRF